VFNCYNGRYKLEARTITDVHPHEKLSFEDIIIKSSNIGAARIGLRLGKERYFRTIQRFGFGRETGVRLPAEEKGILNPLERWGASSVASISFGYEISVTPLQMARAFNVIASGGYLVSPRLLESVVGMRVRQPGRTRVLSAETYHRLLPILTEVVRRGTGRKTHIEGIDIAGKTGTAHKNIRGKYEKVYIASFGGFFPAQNPRVTVYVIVDEPKGLFYGGDVAAPLFRDVTRKLMISLRVFPEVDGSNEIRI
jgi:cell division protein FtsI (penicillin-binding protein 3)